ncbi:LysM peptidoglycan-binding domain-containing protein [Alicyclobacillus dauci]|uniref:LysM peptidoglycan-binding domain-containing protein n=1 Tax=Alicyclobacillus dauci TaxID=1475485 RepID=A0ABY6Z780_9BACL|nr:LysM peptidoglycan-binding domain-containing protein [Alicyclobacillus dauci]WAH38114.1 LysM peptidoglycan-binding domain-containing protein [Alicyclobacillus dauci]
MRIHRVRQGETLQQIAGDYVVSVRDIVRVNELSSHDVLVPGLNLLIPKGDPLAVQAYTIQPGDTFQSIGERFGLTANVLTTWTGYDPSESLPVGTRIYLPVRRPSKRTIEVNGYLLPTGTPSDARIFQTISDMTYFCSFSYQARADGTLEEPKDNVALAAAKRAGIRPLMTMTNFDGNQFNTTLAHTILANNSIRRKVIDQTIAVCTRKGFGGVNVDFEHMQPGDRPLYNQYLRELRDALHAQGLSVSIAMGPKTGDNPNQPWMGAFDYRTIGQEVDFLMLMTYEWGWVGGPPLAPRLLHDF